jgi:membrane protein required for beta-lactamase induction
MTLLAILISLFTERVWTDIGTLRSFTWFERLIDRQRRTRGGAGPGALGLILITVLPLLAVAMLQVLLYKILAVLGLVFATAVLLYSLGPRDLDREVHGFLEAWEQGDESKALDCARRIHGVTGASFPAASPARSVVEGILVAGHERWFGVIFWFLVLGPLGALWYRLAGLLRERCLDIEGADEFRDAALMMHHILAWIPVRLTVVTYALAGSFADTFEALRGEAYDWKSDWTADNQQLLIRGGLGALQLEQELAADETAVGIRHVRAALGLVLRTLIIAVAVIAMITVGAWAAS